MILMHAGQPGTRRRSMARPVGGRAHSTVVEYEGESNEVSKAIRKASQPVSSSRTLAIHGKVHFGMAPGARNPCHGRQKNIEPSEEREEKAATCSVEVTEAPAFGRRMNGRQRGEQDWTQRGIFKLGFNAGSPRVRGARKFTK